MRVEEIMKISTINNISIVTIYLFFFYVILSLSSSSLWSIISWFWTTPLTMCLEHTKHTLCRWWQIPYEVLLHLIWLTSTAAAAAAATNRMAGCMIIYDKFYVSFNNKKRKKIKWLIDICWINKLTFFFSYIAYLTFK